MGKQGKWAARAMVGLMLLLGTSCVAPVAPKVVQILPLRVTDARELVRRLAPDLSEQEIAALPEQTRAPLTAAPGAAQPFLEQAATPDDAARARACLTAAVYYEARSEAAEGQRAVAQVVLNRVRDRAFPNSVCGVVYQGVGSGKACQFSFACDGSTLRPREPDAWTRAQRVAVAALNGSVMDAVGNATFYHAGYVLPWWASSLTRLGAIGSHIFYRWPGALERALGFHARYAGVEPGAPAPRAEAGVVVVRGGFGGVTVHRGTGDVAASAEESVAPADLPARSFGGVRVHRNEDAPLIAGEAAAALGA